MVRITFYLSRPKSAPKKKVVPAGRPDIDKLARAVLDGLTEGGAWLDDGQVVTLHASKVYATEDYPPGCTIEIGLFQS
jgi:Holliday junction resolvase RusA-like endonuclease